MFVGKIMVKCMMFVLHVCRELRCNHTIGGPMANCAGSNCECLTIRTPASNGTECKSRYRKKKEHHIMKQGHLLKIDICRNGV